MTNGLKTPIYLEGMELIVIIWMSDMGSQIQREKQSTVMPKENADEDPWHLSERHNIKHLNTQYVRTIDLAQQVRLQDDRWTERATTWDPYIGKRFLGRPRPKWLDLFRKQAGIQWTSIARNKKELKELELQLSDQVTVGNIIVGE
ncbi:uncharacterized protein LOC124722364 [Schistocerca piceifrons]|uniref:uncharacterized protein LOC124722364 n=1 Tax=Schistocerca piceifrons TaxID=274613 RepID=UPI001F5F5557|nr:uncharacterized protein LOC124722364 [Schistocerca piceifrons]